MNIVDYPGYPQTPNDQTRWVKWFHHLVKMPKKPGTEERDIWEWGYVHVRPAVAIVVVDEHKNLVLVTQYRYPFGDDLVEIVKGFVEDDEEPLAAAQRELQEEVQRSRS